MTPKEKAIELVNKFDNLLPCEGTTTGQTPIDCALICVDEIIKEIKDLYFNHDIEENNSSVDYYERVKIEINKL